MMSRKKGNYFLHADYIYEDGRRQYLFAITRIVLTMTTETNEFTITRLDTVLPT